MSLRGVIRQAHDDVAICVEIASLTLAMTKTLDPRLREDDKYFRSRIKCGMTVFWISGYSPEDGRGDRDDRKVWDDGCWDCSGLL